MNFFIFSVLEFSLLHTISEPLGGTRLFRAVQSEQFKSTAFLHLRLSQDFVSRSCLTIRGGAKSRRKMRRRELSGRRDDSSASDGGIGNGESNEGSSDAGEILSSLSDAEEALRPPAESWTSDDAPQDIEDVDPDPLVTHSFEITQPSID
jgi:hypothetical protein